MVEKAGFISGSELRGLLEGVILSPLSSTCQLTDLSLLRGSQYTCSK